MVHRPHCVKRTEGPEAAFSETFGVRAGRVIADQYITEDDSVDVDAESPEGVCIFNHLLKFQPVVELD